MKLSILVGIAVAACTPSPQLLADADKRGTLPLGELPPQELAVGQCALFLWERIAGAGRRVMMVTAEPAAARIVLGGRLHRLDQQAASGEPAFGIAPKARYAGAGLTIETDLALEASTALAGGLAVRQGSVTVVRPDGTAAVAPVGGLIGCR